MSQSQTSEESDQAPKKPATDWPGLSLSCQQKTAQQRQHAMTVTFQRTGVEAQRWRKAGGARFQHVWVPLSISRNGRKSHCRTATHSASSAAAGSVLQDKECPFQPLLPSQDSEKYLQSLELAMEDHTAGRSIP